MRLIESTIKAIRPPESGHRIDFDDSIPGFGIRTTAAGFKAFVLDYRIDGRKRRYTIGRYGDLTATAARKDALKLRAQVSDGGDPLAEKQQRRTDPTFGDLAKEYLDRHASKKRSGERDRQYLENDVLPRWRSIKARAITRADVLKLIEGKAAKAPTAANRLLAVVRKMFNFGIERGLVESSPCAVVRAPTKERQRDRVLSPDEIHTVWTGMDDAKGVSEPMKAALRLVLATGQRPGEVAAMEWRELDLEAGWWTVPAARAKNGLAHRVPLNSLAKRLIEAQRPAKKTKRSARYVFPAQRGDRPIEVNSLAQAVRRADGFGAAKWTPHDLRRTAATMIASAGAGRVVVGKILNHAESSITAVYDRSGYDREKKSALDAWGRKLDAIVKGKKQAASKVVEFPA